MSKENSISRNELGSIITRLENAPRVESSKVQYAREKNLRKMKSTVEDWDKGNKPEKLQQYWNDRNELILDLAKQGNIQVNQNDNVIQVLSMMPEKLQLKFNKKNEELRTEEIEKMEREYIDACKSRDIEFSPHRVKLSEFPEKYNHTDLFFDIIEEG